MDLDARLRAFAAVARTGSFSRAAEATHVSQPAISKHLAGLETELGVKLVARGAGGATLTPPGQVLADYVLRAQALLANAGRALAAGGDAQIGKLAFAASGIPGTYLLPTPLASFHEQHPAVEIDFRLTTSGGALELVRAHEVELAVVGGMTVPHELESEPLAEDDVVLVGPPSSGGRRLRPKELEAWTWISREEGSSTRAAVEANPRAALVGSGQARRRERRRNRGDQSLCPAARAAGRDAGRARRPSLAVDPDDLDRTCTRCAA